MTLPALTALGFAGLLASQSAFATSAADFYALARNCDLSVPIKALAPIIKVESHFNPYAIGVVGGRLARQPTTKEEAIATAKSLEAAGHKFSAGIGQVYRGNWAAYGLTADTVFEPCKNLRASSGIFESCHVRAKAEFPDEELARQAAYSCYYSNNFTTGFKPDFLGQPSYVDKVMLSAVMLENQPTPTVQAIPFIPNKATVETSSPTLLSQAVKKPVGPEQVVFDSNSSPTPVSAATSEPVKLTAKLAVQPAPTPIPPAELSPYVYSSQAVESQVSAAELVY